MYKTWKKRAFELSIDTKSWSSVFGIVYHHGFYFNRRCKLSIHVGPLALFLNMPWVTANEKQRDSCEWPSYGFDVFRQSMHLIWGMHFKTVNFPWAWQWVRRSYLKADGSWLHETPHKRPAPNCALGSSHPFYHAESDDTLFREEYPYTYNLKNGVVQNVTATIRVSETEWRWRGFKWLPWPRKVIRGIDITFSDEVGERAGSWKGGCLGCGYNMLKGETPLQALRRMEKERSF